ncbi:hypothetical protein BDA96_02G053400 [Sorghum bicolor]|uniref:Knottin scorpion toxin-like domain-containing protein n=2 Tax=Sorghum bicolor TaxID=4558 RepID=A0A921RKG7_SORBI|nr:hypothetical protein BDA96_02G053400 [Sorghum bicolor]OQU88538.1 hypothetical protein SORBI_3002G053201 [Sorghum bicolor]
MMAKMMGSSSRKSTLILLLIVVLIASQDEASIGVDAACNNLPINCYIKCLRPGACNRCCKQSHFVRGECIGWDCWCCRS